MTAANLNIARQNCSSPLRIHVIIATYGRPDSVRKLLKHLENQTRPADGIVVIGTCPADIAGLDNVSANTRVIVGPRGTCCQRNSGIEMIKDEADVVIFFDDDFVPANDYLAATEALMVADPEIAGLTGMLVDDGVSHEPIPFDVAVRRLEIDGERPPQTEHLPRQALYGCNMAMRLAVLGDLRFDENLPLYGWLEDVDLTYQLGKRGKLISGPEITGIHLGDRGGRQPGKRLGYSQVANVIYLYRKGTMQPDIGWRQLLKNISANLVHSISPEPHIDRRGRLAGNLLAIADFLRGKLDPRKIVSL
ncbi:glycosyltransferase family 2 protein [Novosphingobium sp. PY1]|uniref:glycosyltransferase family 2 protein n=1 Tax=Novosphingobium sp. PY1 TaxID=1882221 RepID=UPI001A8F3172|nr:glycosyltransferase [Novosphingobium sp. PY1]GFM27438.1 family 2 glycosyl transferase [Novosphingobium sp. PY1]